VCDESTNLFALLPKASYKPLEVADSQTGYHGGPVIRGAHRPFSSLVEEEPSKLPLEDVCSADGIVGFKQFFKFAAGVGIEIFLVAEDQTALALYELTVLLARLTALSPAHFVDVLIDVHHQVEPVIDDVRVKNPSLHRSLIGSGTIDADASMPARCLSMSCAKNDSTHSFFLPPACGAVLR
jgi:hypothetical protein